jgi:hypothetical protein
MNNIKGMIILTKTKQEVLDRVVYIERRINELKIDITEHEREGNKRNYKFYEHGAKLYRELASLKTELIVAKRIIGN